MQYKIDKTFNVNIKTILKKYYSEENAGLNKNQQIGQKNIHLKVEENVLYFQKPEFIAVKK